MVNGGADNVDSDVLSTYFPGTPGPFKWEAHNGSLSPLTSDRRITQVCSMFHFSTLIMSGLLNS